MSKPKIRHLAIFVRDPAKIAKFYQEVFEMELLGEPAASGAHYVSDGHVTLALCRTDLPHLLRPVSITSALPFPIAPR